MIIHLELLGGHCLKDLSERELIKGKPGKSKETQTNTEVMVTLLALGQDTAEDTSSVVVSPWVQIQLPP